MKRGKGPSTGAHDTLGSQLSCLAHELVLFIARSWDAPQEALTPKSSGGSPLQGLRGTCASLSGACRIQALARCICQKVFPGLKRGLVSRMVEGHQCHRVARAHRKALMGQAFAAHSPNGRFADGARPSYTWVVQKCC